MSSRRLAGHAVTVLGIVVLAMVGVLATSRPVALRTWARVAAPSPQVIGCYLSGVDGTLVTDAEAGTAIVEDVGPGAGQRSAISWPAGYWGLSVLGTTVVFDGRGPLPVARTGARLHIPGGFHDGSFEACFEGVGSLD
ncbi:MAG TPA: hypothetical protein VFS32_11925 [Candidatus Limnocylindrales bacterium]|nr:hypothetical protein [Candidatus Limnocylindrales bacterium]